METYKRLLSPLVLFFALLAANPLTAQTAYPTIPQISEPPVIDGLIDDIWLAQHAFRIEKLNYGQVENAADHTAAWYGLWDADYIYLLVDVTDQFLEDTAGADGWRNDIVEVYFDMDNNKQGTAHEADNYQYAFNWNKPDEESVVPNGSWEGVIWSQTTSDTGYIFEIKIPWTTLTNLTIGVGYAFGFDMAVNDNDGFSVYDSVYYWNNPTRSGLWSNMSNAGTVELGEAFDGNFPPILSPVDTLIAFEGTIATFDVVASDLNASDSLSFSHEDLPAFASLSDKGNGTEELTIDAVPGDAGIYEFTVTVSDGAKTDTGTVILIVKDPNVPTQLPNFTAVGNTTVIGGNQRVIQVQVTDIDSLEVEISAIELPEFASIEDNGNKTATVVFSPDESVPTGDYPVSLKVVDPDNNEATLDFTAVVVEDSGRTVFYCDPVGGSMENDGSAASPWAGLAETMDAGILFDAGDILYLRDGYHGLVVVTDDNPGTVTIMPDAGASPRAGMLLFAGAASNWHIDHLEISASFADAFPGGRMVTISGENNRLSNLNIYTVEDASQWDLNDWLSRPRSGVQMGGTHNILEYSTIRNVRMGIDAGGTSNTIRGNSIHNFTVDGIRVPGNYTVIEDNLITDNYNIDDNHDDGIQSYTYGDPVKGVILRRNTIIQTTDPDRPFKGSLQGVGCFDGMFQDWVVENNVVLVTAYHGITFLGAIDCRIVNNTVVSLNAATTSGRVWIMIDPHKNANDTSLSAEERAYLRGGGNLVANNLASWISVQPELATIEKNSLVTTQFLDALFVDFPTDMRLVEGSPAIDIGLNEYAPADDASGSPRPIDGDGDGTATVDLGAYEFSASWRGIPVIFGTVDSGTGFGWLEITQDPWVFSYGMLKWIYMDASWTATTGGWVFLPK